MKVVINDGVGSFGLSMDAYDYLELDWEQDVVYPLERASPGISREVGLLGRYSEENRTNPKLVECIEKLGLVASSEYSHLVVVNVDDKRPWQIETDDTGWERIKYLDEGI